MNTKSLRILIIDDMPEVHESFIKILGSQKNNNDALNALARDLFASEEHLHPQHMHFKISSALQGEQGLEEVEEEQPIMSPMH